MRTGTFAAARLAGAALVITGAASLVDGAAAQTPRTAVGLDAEMQTVRHFDAIREEPVELLMFLRAMPKGADLHSHLSGAVFAETYIDWAAEAGLCIDTVGWTFAQPPCDEAAARPPAAAALTNPALRDPLIDALSVRNWHRGAGTAHAQFFGTFDRFRFVSNRPGDMVAEITSRAAAGGVSYLELMQTLDGNGAASIARGLGWIDDFDVLRERLLAGGLRDTLANARRRLDEAEHGWRERLQCGTAAADPGCAVEVRYLYQALRARAPEIVFAHLLAGFELATADPRVVGINLVQPEDHPVSMRDYSLHMRMIRALRQHYPRVGVALHAGELAAGLVPPEGLRFHIAEAVRVAGADRIGHGTAIAFEDDADGLLAEMARRGVLLEAALSSNAFILGVSGREHPLGTYLRRGVPVALVTDDEGVLRSEMTLEFLRAVQEHGLGYIQLKALARNSLEHAFIEGESLWRPGTRAPVAACEQLDAPACRAFIDGSAKARLQAGLERALMAFERRFAERLD